jgi:NADPH:quinone reductase-like Zn-dependent oxidoreductase
VRSKGPGCGKEKEGLDLAGQFGRRFLDRCSKKPFRSDQEITKGKGVDAVIDLLDRKRLLHGLSRFVLGGKLIVVGWRAPGQPFPLDTMAMHYNEWEIKGAVFQRRLNFCR